MNFIKFYSKFHENSSNFSNFFIFYPLLHLNESLTSFLFYFQIAFWLIEHLGRRTLLLWGAAGILATLLALGVVLIRDPPGLALGWLALLLIASFLGFYAISYGPISWLYMSEVFPQNLRASGMSVATMVNWATQALVSFTFLPMLKSWGPTAVFWVYGGVGVLAFIFIFYRVPETRGKSLEELAALFSHTPSVNATNGVRQPSEESSA